MDTITYSKNLDGTFTKTVVSVTIVDTASVDNEITALQAQIDAFATPADTKTAQAQLDTATTDYQAQIDILKS